MLFYGTETTYMDQTGVLHAPPSFTDTSAAGEKNFGKIRAVNGCMVGAENGHHIAIESQSWDGKQNVGPDPWEVEHQCVYSDT